MSKGIRLGIFVVVTLLILFAGIFLIGNQEMRFKSTYQVKAEFQNAGGLIGGADVRVGGIRKGSVKAIDLPKETGGKVTVVMNLESDTRPIVKTDSVASIKSEGMMGDKFVEISFGSKNAEEVKDGGTIESEPPLGLSDLLKKADHILDTAESAAQGVQETASNLASISSKINEGKGSVGALINSRTIYNQAAKATTNLQADTEAIKHNFLLRGFFKNRGYEDSEELAKDRIARLPAGAPIKTFTYEAKQIFDKPDTAKLKDQKKLNDAGKFLEQNRFGLVVVASYAGEKGDSEKDRVLTEARSAVVRDYLVQNFRLEDDTRIKTIGFGKTGAANDRPKVEILVYPVGVETPAAPRQTSKTR